jgi:beta-galactosidase
MRKSKFGNPCLLLVNLLASLLLLSAAASAEPQPISFGADFYAEDHSPEQIEMDASAMQRAGFNLVRMLDTNWAAIEPQDGKFDFTWLDRTLDILARHEIRAILGVPSYVPPYWMLKAHPEFLLMDRRGEQYKPGGMGGVNLLNPQYQQYVQRMDEALARHYGRDKRVAGWQIDNEIGIWGGPCYNRECVRAFQNRLREKFGTIDALNRRWGTVSYGHKFTSFEEVPLDALPVFEGHQAALEYQARLFFSDIQVKSIEEQAQIFRRLAPGQIILHNATGPNETCNYFDLAKVVDQLGYDNYPQMGDHFSPAFNFDLARGYNRGNPYLILEELAGAQGPYTYTTAEPPPGQLRLWAYQALAHGANGILFFRWRTARSGSEEFWQGILDPAGNDNRRLREISAMGAEIRKLGPLLANTRVQSRVALVYSWNAWRAQEVGGVRSHYLEHLRNWHTSLAAFGNTDVVQPASDLSNYAVVVAPDLFLLDRGVAENFRRFVSNGGTLIVGPRSGIKDEDNRFFLGSPQPGPLLPLTGAAVEETTTLTGEQHASDDYVPEAGNTIHSPAAGWAGTFPAMQIAEMLSPTGGTALFQYDRDYYRGRPAVTVNSFGKGKTYYVGTGTSAEFRSFLLKRVFSDMGITLREPAPPGLEIVERAAKRNALLFLLNFSAHPATMNVSKGYTDALTGADAGSEIMIRPLDLRILHRPE